MKTHMDHAEIINISIEMEREFKLPMLPPSELEFIRYQLSISYDLNTVKLMMESTP